MYKTMIYVEAQEDTWETLSFKGALCRSGDVRERFSLTKCRGLTNKLSLFS